MFKFTYYWLSWFTRRIFVKHPSLFLSFLIILPVPVNAWESEPSFNKTLIIKALPPRMLCTKYLSRVLRMLFKTPNPIFFLSSLFPVEGDLTLYFNRLESPTPKNAYCQVWFKLAHWLWIRWIYKKFTTTTTTTENGKSLSEKLTWAYGPGELKINIACCCSHMDKCITCNMVVKSQYEALLFLIYYYYFFLIYFWNTSFEYWVIDKSQKRM